uniref:Uncharacterized protein n=1 Tax=Anopheles coluzzii TaxID=1518534 RepID=A0A8W7PPL1_ANOCL
MSETVANPFQHLAAKGRRTRVHGSGAEIPSDQICHPTAAPEEMWRDANDVHRKACCFWPSIDEEPWWSARFKGPQAIWYEPLDTCSFMGLKRLNTFPDATYLSRNRLDQTPIKAIVSRRLLRSLIEEAPQRYCSDGAQQTSKNLKPTEQNSATHWVNPAGS